MLRLRFLVIQDPCGDVANHFLANVLLYGVFLLCLHDIYKDRRDERMVQPGVQAEADMFFA